MNKQDMNWRLLTLITDMDRRNKVEAILEDHGPLAYLILRAKGTTKKSWLHQIGIKDAEKMQLELLLDPARELEMMDALADGLRLDKPGHGILYSTEVIYHLSKLSNLDPEKLHNICESICLTEDNEEMYKKISVIVDLGMSDDVIEAARAAGARGGTVVHGLGTATSEHATIFGFKIVPEKEMVVILTPNEVVEQVILSIHSSLNLDGHANGILYVQPVTATVGMFESTLN